MRTLSIFTAITVLLLPLLAISQTPFASIKAVPGFQVTDYSTATFNAATNSYHINTLDANRMTRRMYDSNFKLIKEYSFDAPLIDFSNKLAGSIRFFGALPTSKGYFELYAYKDELKVYEIDFDSGADKLVTSFLFNEKKTGERPIAMMPDNEELKFLTYSKKDNYMKVYRWVPGDSLKSYQFRVPEKGLSAEEEKIYTKSCQVRYKNLFPVRSSQLNTQQIFPSFSNVIFRDDRIYMMIDIPFYVGIHLITIDLTANSFTTKNFFFNDLRRNAGDDNEKIYRFTNTIVDSVLVVQNSSHYWFEYLFYNINSGELIKKHSLPVEDSIYQLVHSGFTQKGTYISKNQEKEIKREKAFMRKVSGVLPLNSIAEIKGDSITLTLSSIQQTSGIGGTLLSFATSAVATLMLGDIMGNAIFVPYLSSKRFKLYYFHSTFSKKTWKPAPPHVATTGLDQVLDSFEAKELHGNSTFYILKPRETLIGVFNKETASFDIFKFANGK
jgi:hypothetical protein